MCAIIQITTEAVYLVRDQGHGGGVGGLPDSKPNTQKL